MHEKKAPIAYTAASAIQSFVRMLNFSWREFIKNIIKIITGTSTFKVINSPI